MGWDGLHVLYGVKVGWDGMGWDVTTSRGGAKNKQLSKQLYDTI